MLLMRKLLAVVLWLIFPIVLRGQVETDSLPKHSGAMTLDLTTPAAAPPMLVGWSYAGGIPLPQDPAWTVKLLSVYDEAARPVVQFRNDQTKVTLSFILFENLSGKPTSEGCRQDLMEGLRKSQGELLSNSSSGTLDDGHGGTFATASHFTRLTSKTHNHDVFAFSGNAKTCAEAHASTIGGSPDEEKNLAAALALFHPDLSYRPTCAHYLPEANAFYKQAPMTGAPFYDACLKTIPKDTQDATQVHDRRLAVDQIVIALGMAGQVARARHYADDAIKLDPDYPLNYYNLACADAEEGKASAARVHLEQAFARRQNTLAGEELPDPEKDDSILKLKGNTEFWAFVQAIPKS